MIKTNNLVENEDGHLSITEKCAFNVEMLENDLPITIREKAVELAAKTARLELYKKENRNGYSVFMAPSIAMWLIYYIN